MQKNSNQPGSSIDLQKSRDENDLNRLSRWVFQAAADEQIKICAMGVVTLPYT